MEEVLNTRKIVDFMVTLPNHNTYVFQLPYDCKGQECLDKICHILGIIESDYFGLKFTERQTGWKIWLNNRQQVKHQITSRPPYQLMLCVKYYTDVNLILQPTTLDAFFMTVKRQIKEGSLLLQDVQKGTIGAFIAQAELGDIAEVGVPSGSVAEAQSQYGYPEYFPEWSGGIVKNIADEHRKLRGMPTVEAKRNFLRHASALFCYGLEMTKVIISDGQQAMVGIGGDAIHIFDMQWNYIRKIPYNHLTTVLYGIDNFTVRFKTRNQQQEVVNQRMKLIVPTTAIAKSLFRFTIENLTFFLHPTVDDYIRNHAHMPSMTKCKLLLKQLLKVNIKAEPGYYFDLARTKHEAYTYAWQRLHQVNQDETNSSARAEASPPPPAANSITEATDIYSPSMVPFSCTSSSGMQAKSKLNLFWGLSQSSCNLAKELLPNSQLAKSSFEEFLSTFVVGKGEQEEVRAKEEKEGEEEEEPATEEKLTESQGKKLRCLLLKIHNQQTCRVCMDNPISAVFCPCGHHIACYKCAVRVPRCPLCRDEIGFVQYVYCSTS